MAGTGKCYGSICWCFCCLCSCVCLQCPGHMLHAQLSEELNKPTIIVTLLGATAGAGRVIRTVPILQMRTLWLKEVFPPPLCSPYQIQSAF